MSLISLLALFDLTASAPGFHGHQHHLRQGFPPIWSRGVAVSPISRFLGSAHLKPTRTRQFSGEARGRRSAGHADLRSEPGSERPSSVACVSVCDWRDGTGQGSTPELQGLNLRRQGADVLSGGPGHGVPPLQDLSIEFSISTCPCRRRRVCFPIPPASEPVPAVLAHACDAGARS